jgi:hypothetical protein
MLICPESGDTRGQLAHVYKDDLGWYGFANDSFWMTSGTYPSLEAAKRAMEDAVK